MTHQNKIKELEDKLARTFAEMENQRRRFEKEKDDAFDYGGFTFAKEALNLIDNLERSKLILESDETLKETEALKKTLEHLELELQKIRASKATPSMLQSVMVDYYGTPTPISKVANVGTMDARTLTVQAWEKNILNDSTF